MENWTGSGEAQKELHAKQTLLDNMGALIFSKDLELRYTYANQSLCRLYGVELPELIGHQADEFVDAETSQRLRAVDCRVIIQGVPDHITCAFRFRHCPDVHHYLTLKAPLKDVRGEVIGLSGVAVNVTEQVLNEKRLHEQWQLLDTVLTHMPGLVFMKDRQRRYLYANQAVADLFKRPPEALIGHRDEELLPAAAAALLREQDERTLASGIPQAHECEIRDPDGCLRAFQCVHLIVPHADQPDRLLGLCTETTATRQAEKRFQTLFDTSTEPFFVAIRNRITDCNRAALQLLGAQSKSQVLGRGVRALSPPLQPGGVPSAKCLAEIADKVQRDGTLKFEWTVRRLDNRIDVPVEVVITLTELDGHTALFAAVRDLSERKDYEERIHHLAYFDTLTGLPNRRLFFDRLAQSLAQSQRSGQHGALIYLDLDNFKPLNDFHGHEAGDQLLREVAGRLLQCVRQQDTVARLGGDEFVVLLGQIEAKYPLSQQTSTRDHAIRIAERIRDELARPYLLSLQEASGKPYVVGHQCSASLGVTLFPPCELSGEAMLQRADKAMYAAKHAGRNRICFADSGQTH
ncbi:sensor domain-containing diguanylate cyclase [Zoogloea sp.]|uniref:sensor domain-containing protein n=1 Tax=Zoogloea sp. TaxID=49181 RepID=UPI00261C1029|nr:sensor domain-containing diguanylate cyclase [Zoogloea sp.]MDD3355063.1 sensor domain-containing diguanylate cyclase [Zoogloea sp.]